LWCDPKSTFVLRERGWYARWRELSLQVVGVLLSSDPHHKMLASGQVCLAEQSDWQRARAVSVRGGEPSAHVLKREAKGMALNKAAVTRR
jgi:hypothetical protein